MKNQRISKPLWAGLITVLMTLQSWLASPVQATTVLTSIQPIYLLTRDLLPPEVEVQRLLPPGVTPHGFQMAVSQRKMLSEADLVVWVGPTMEVFLGSVVKQTPNLELANVAALSWPAASQRDDGHQHGVGDNKDPHIWLSPANGMAIAEAIVDAVSTIAPELNEVLAQRLAAFKQQLQIAEQQWRQELLSLSNQPWMLYHDAAQHFEHYFGLNHYQIITRTPEAKPGAKYLHQLRQNVQPGQCLLVEAYYPTKQASKLAREFNLRLTTYDPLGSNANSYQALIDNMVGQVAYCLSANQP
jgi:zinc transport system substrate-binding protein